MSQSQADIRRAQVRAARKVLFDHKRTTVLKTEMSSVKTLMNLDPGEAISPDDPRGEPGAGPLWFVPATGEVDPAVAEAAQRCERIAKVLAETREALADVKIPGKDKQRLREGYRQLELAWRARAKRWRSPEPLGDRPEIDVGAFEKGAAAQFRLVKRYLQGPV